MNQSSPTGAAVSGASPRSVHAVDDTRLVPPRLAPHRMAREALMARLLEARRQRCILIQGPAGSGKTSTMVALREALLPLSFDVAWLSLSAEEDEPGRFFAGLLASLADVDPAMAQDVARLGEKNVLENLLENGEPDEAAVEHGALTLAAAIAARRREVVLMLDDCHHLGDPLILLGLQCLLDHAPPHLHLVFGSRNALPLRLARLRAEGQLSQFDLRDLSFTLAESEAFLRTRLGTIERREAERLHRLTGGWVAGLQLIAVALKSGDGADATLTSLTDADAFASFCENEVLVHLAPDELALLEAASVCESFTAGLAAALLEAPAVAARVAARLKRLESDNMFIERLHTRAGENWYRMHPLLREVLQARLARGDERTRRALHRRAWKWLRENGLQAEAVSHAVLAGEAEAAADEIETCLYELMATGALTELGALVRRLPADVVAQRFRLRVALGGLYLYAGKAGALAALLADMHAEAADKLDAKQHYAYAVLRAGLAMQHDDSDTVAALEPALQRAPAGADDHLLSGSANMLGWMLLCRGDFAGAQAVLEREDHGTGAQRSRLLGRCLAASGQAMGGSMAQAEEACRAVLDEAELHGQGYLGISCLAAGILGDVLYELNDLEGVRRLLAGRVELAERLLMPEGAVTGMMALASSHHAAGRRLEADSLLEQVEDYAGRHGCDRLLARALAMRVRWLSARGAAEQAAVVLARLEALAATHADPASIAAREIRFSLGSARAANCLQWGGAASALDDLPALAEAARTAGHWRRLAALCVQLAQARHMQGNAAGARDALLEAVRVGHDSGLLRSLADASPDLSRLLDVLLPEASLTPVLDFYVRRLRAVAVPAGNVAQAARDAEPLALNRLSERERTVLGMVAQAMTNKTIARALGVSPETVKWHMKNIHQKLGVSGRDEAAARWRDLSLGKEPPAQE